METLEIKNSRGGNTSSPRVVPSKRWCFTFFFRDIRDLETLEITFNSLKIEYIIGLEKCPETGKEHFQGYIESPTKIRPIEKLQKLFKQNGGDHFTEIHWEKCKGNREHNITYCSKDGCFHTTFDIDEDDLLEFINKGTLYDYQKEVLSLIESKPDKRTIHWFYETEGNMGKTALIKHILMKYKEKATYINGKGNDIKYCISSLRNKPKICIFGYPRDKEEYISYGILLFF